MVRRGSRFKAVVALCMGGLAAIAIMELSFRLIEITPLWRVLPGIEPQLGAPDWDTGYVFTPGATGVSQREHHAKVQINLLGLRDAERTLAKPPGTIRIGLLGDSMVEALQVEQSATFGALAERELSEKGHAVEVINLAMSANGPLRQLVRLEKIGYEFNLDMVVSVTRVGNFLTGELLDDSLNPGYVPDKNGGLERGFAYRQRSSVRNAEAWSGRAFLSLLRTSAVARMIYLRSRDPLPQMLGLKSAVAAAVPLRDDCSAAELDPILRLWRDHQPQRLWQGTVRALDDFAESTGRRNLPVIFALSGIPLPKASCPVQRATRAELMATIAHEFTGRGLGFSDWTAALAAVTGADDDSGLRPLVGFGQQKGTGHLNYAGHRAYAAALVRAVTTRLDAKSEMTSPKPAD